MGSLGAIFSNKDSVPQFSAGARARHQDASCPQHAECRCSGGGIGAAARGFLRAIPQKHNAVLSGWFIRTMSIDDTKGQLSQQMDALQKSWGLSADYSNESLSNGDILQQCSIGDIAIISKLKPRQMQAFADSTSALGLRVVGVLSKLLEQQVKSP
jgi:hypothetical protein